VKHLATFFLMAFLVQVAAADNQGADGLSLYNALVADLCNASTTGYKAIGPSGGERDLEAQGALMVTDRPLDLALVGKGFFCYRNSAADDLYYSRDGSLHIGADGYLANEAGDSLWPLIAIPPGVGSDSLTVGRDGAVLARGPGRERVRIGKVLVHVPKDYATVGATDGLKFHFRHATSGENERLAIVCGCLETSTVAVVDVLKRCLVLLGRLGTDGAVPKEVAETKAAQIRQYLERLSNQESPGNASQFERLHIESSVYPTGAP